MFFRVPSTQLYPRPGYHTVHQLIICTTLDHDASSLLNCNTGPRNLIEVSDMESFMLRTVRVLPAARASARPGGKPLCMSVLPIACVFLPLQDR